MELTGTLAEMGASFTLLNLTDVEDSAVRHGQSGLEARFARAALGLEQSGISHFRFEPGFRVPFGHLHREQEEVYLVLRGSARARLDDEVIELGPMDALRIAPGVMRGIEAGPDGAEMLAFGAPNTENQDIEMAPGWWSDPGDGGAAPGG